jgi:hypothetical protein
MKFTKRQLKNVVPIRKLLRKHTLEGLIQVGKLACIGSGSYENVKLHHAKSLA